MNGDSKIIFDRVGIVEDHCIGMKKDIEYIKENLDKHLINGDERMKQGYCDLNKLTERVNWNENKIYLFLGAAVVISTVVSLIVPTFLGTVF